MLTRALFIFVALLLLSLLPHSVQAQFCDTCEGKQIYGPAYNVTNCPFGGWIKVNPATATYQIKRDSIDPDVYLITVKPLVGAASKNVANCKFSTDQIPKHAYVSTYPPIYDTGLLVAEDHSSMWGAFVGATFAPDGSHSSLTYRVRAGFKGFHQYGYLSPFTLYPSGEPDSPYPSVYVPVTVPAEGTPAPTCTATSTGENCNQKLTQNANPPSTKANPFRCEKGDPCDVFSLNYYHHETDLELSAFMPLSVKRTYYSGKNTFVGEFGIGSHLEDYNYRLTVPKNKQGQVILTANTQLVFNPGNGANIIFTNPNGGNVFIHKNDIGTAGDTITLYTDSAQKFTKAVYTELDRSQQIFNAAGYMVSWQDRRGNALAFSRATNGRLLSVQDVVTGRRFNFAYNSAGLISNVTDSTGRKVLYTYSAANELLTVTNPAGKKKSYTWDNNHRIVSKTDFKGTTQMGVEYSSTGMLTQQIQEDGSVLRFAANSNTVRKVQRPDEGIETYIYNNQGYLTEFRDANGKRFKTTYSPSIFSNTPTGRYIQTTDPLGRTTRTDLNSNDLPTLITDANGNKTRFTYSSTFPDKILTITDPLLHQFSFTYNNLGNLTKVTDPAGNVSTFTYNTRGQILTAINAMGQKSTYAYDAVGQLVSVINALGQKIQYSYDALGRVIKVVDPKGLITTLTYDVMNRPTSIKNALGQVTSITYDGNGNALTTKNARGYITSYQYDGRNRLTTVTNPKNALTRYEYDSNSDQLAWIYDPKNLTRHGYDKSDWLQYTTFSDDSSRSYTRNAVGEVLSVTDGTNTFSFTYDKLGRVSTHTAPNGTLSYTYDADSKLTRLASPQYGTVNYGYDNLDRMTSVTKDAKQYSYTYAPLGNRTSVTRPNGIVTVYEYDNGNRVVAITHAKGTTALERETLTYDVNNNVVKIVRDQGTLTSITDVAVGKGFKKQVNGYKPTAGTDIEQRYTYDALNRLIKVVAIGYVPGKSTFANATRKTAALNALAQAKAATTPAALEQALKSAEAQGAFIPENASWTYDANGNIATKVIRWPQGALETRTFTYDNADRLTKMVKSGASTGTVTYTYDANGNLVSDSKGRRLTWNALDQLTSLQTPLLSANFSYDPLGRRAEYTRGSTVKNYFYNGLTMLSDGTSKFLDGLGMDEHLQLENSTGTLSYLSDHLGSTSHLLDGTSAAQKARYDYKSYGKLEGDVSNPSLNNPFTYTGREDDGTGLMYYRARYYDPELERFIADDPLGDAQRYVDGNPVSFVDPLGLAYFARQPLFGIWIDPFSQTTGPQNDYNFEVNHEHLFFEDNLPKTKSNVGYGPNGLFYDQNPKDYPRKEILKYNDCIMRQAYNAIKDQYKPGMFKPQGYWPLGRNCQSFAQALRDKYAELMRNSANRTRCGL